MVTFYLKYTQPLLLFITFMLLTHFCFVFLCIISQFYTADASNSLNKVYHLTGLVLAVVTPIAFIASPSIISLPVDYALGLIIPLHAHVGLNYVVTDYVPKAVRSVARLGVLGLTLITAAGILKLNFDGPGLTETIKSTWKAPIKKPEQQ